MTNALGLERVKYTHSDGVKKLRPKSIRNVIGVLKLILGKKGLA